MGTYTFFDHTGDYGVDLEAPDEEGLVEAFARAFVDLLTGSPESVGETVEREVEVEGLDFVDLLVAFGNELVFLFEVEGFLCASFEVSEFDDQLLVGVARGEVYDPERHPISRPMKAVTHHGACLEEGPAGVRARIVFDL